LSGCCGDSAVIASKIIAARNLGIWEDPGGFTLAKKSDATSSDSSVQDQDQVQEENPYVRVGPQAGSVTYIGLTGESYKAGNNPQDRIVNALRGDAEKLLNLRDEVGRPIFQLADGEKLPEAPAADQVTVPAPNGESIPLDPALQQNAGVAADVAAAQETAVADAVANSTDSKSK
jgi:hypothetical protein